jgi:hypothetical protein
VVNDSQRRATLPIRQRRHLHPDEFRQWTWIYLAGISPLGGRLFEPLGAFSSELVVNAIFYGRRPLGLRYTDVCPLILREDIPENVHAFSDSQPNQSGI